MPISMNLISQSPSVQIRDQKVGSKSWKNFASWHRSFSFRHFLPARVKLH